VDQASQTDTLPLKRPVGRPRKDGQPAGSVPKEETAAAPDQGEGEDLDFFQWIKTFPADAWREELFMYLYRTAPQIDLGRKGEWSVEKLVRPVDQQYILENHGSGGYKILLDRWDPSTSKTYILRTHYCMLVNMNYPPRVPLGVWIDKPENATWLWAKSALQAQMAGPTPTPQSASAGATDIFKAAIEAVKELKGDVGGSEKATLTEMVISMVGQANNPANTLALVNSIVGAIAGKSNGESSDTMRLVTMQLDGLQKELAAERAFGRELLTKLTTPPGAAPDKQPSMREHITELKDVVELLGMNKGGGGSHNKTDWGEVAIDVGKELLKSLTVVATAIITKTPAKAAAAAGARTNTPAQTVTTQPQIQAADQPAPAAETNSQPAPEETMSIIQQFSDQFGGLFDEVAPFLVDQFVRGISGMEFRDWFVERHGTFTYNAIRRMDTKTILGILATRREQAPDHIREQLAQLSPPEAVQQFIEEFVSDAPAFPEDEEEPAPAERPGAPPVPRAAKARTPDEF
jgi:hypothetical protein